MSISTPVGWTGNSFHPIEEGQRPSAPETVPDASIGSVRWRRLSPIARALEMLGDDVEHMAPGKLALARAFAETHGRRLNWQAICRHIQHRRARLDPAGGGFMRRSWLFWIGATVAAAGVAALVSWMTRNTRHLA